MMEQNEQKKERDWLADRVQQVVGEAGQRLSLQRSPVRVQLGGGAS